MTYLTFLRGNFRFIGFGFLLTMLSSYGQTFYVALYGAEIRAEFGLGHGSFGAVFSTVSVVAAVSLIWLGRLIDRVDLRPYTAVTLAALTGSMVVLSFAHSLWLFALALFVIRLCGQGLTFHIMGTTMARYFPQDRGKALSLSGLGLATGETILPITTVALIAAIGWRNVWLATGLVTAAALLVLVPMALKGFDRRHRDYLARQSDGDSRLGEARDWTRLEVLRDPRYLGAMALLLAYPYVSTGVLFHQAFIAEIRGWPIELLAKGLISMAFMKVLTSLAIGPMIDRSGAVRLISVSVLPFIACFAALGASNNPLMPYLFLGALGVGIGMLQPIMSAMFAEMYGVRNLGGIRAMSVAAMVLSAAAAPATFGFLFDLGVSIETVTIGCIIYMAAAALPAFLVLRRHPMPAAD
ncbi:MAG: MFS transporter [Rhodospirillaceae bacterium]|nr:MFS transporter [Rhodospirillaceae bacterium]